MRRGKRIFSPPRTWSSPSCRLKKTRLCFFSGMGKPKIPGTGKGALGRNLTHQVSFAAATAFFEKPLNRFMGSGASGMLMSDFDGDNFDHSQLGFLRGGLLEARNTSWL